MGSLSRDSNQTTAQLNNRWTVNRRPMSGFCSRSSALATNATMPTMHRPSHFAQRLHVSRLPSRRTIKACLMLVSPSFGVILQRPEQRKCYDGTGKLRRGHTGGDRNLAILHTQPASSMKAVRQTRGAGRAAWRARFADPTWRDYATETPQISVAYSRIVRSEENHPMRAVFSTLDRHHAWRSHHRVETFHCVSA